jgi:hypothetical protein
MNSSSAAEARRLDADTRGVTLDDYLDALYPTGTPGDLLAYCKNPFCRRWGVASNLPAFARQIRALDAEGFDVYQTVNTVDGRAIRKRGSATRGTEAEVVGVLAIVADVDAAGKAGHDYPPQPRIFQVLGDMPLSASIVIVSGRADGGLHAYWLLMDPFIIRTDEDRRRIKSISERWQRLLKTKLAPYELDSTFDLVRVLRPIGTTNHKYGTTVQAIVFQPGRRYRVEDFEAHLPAPQAPRPVSYTPVSGADPGSIVARARQYVARIPGAISGSGGHDATFHTVCVLVLGFGLSVDDAFPLLAEWNQTCAPPWSERELRHKLADADKQPGERGCLLREQIEPAADAPYITRLVLQEA